MKPLSERKVPCIRIPVHQYDAPVHDSSSEPPCALRALHPATTLGDVDRRDPHDFFEQLTAVSRRLRSVAAQAYSTFEVGSAQAKFLRHIGRNSRISQADLARATETAPTLTGRALETLIERGWIRRKRSEEDRRQYALELTASGQRARERVEAVREGLISRLATVLDDRDVEDFERIAKKILAAFEPPSDPRSGE
ncbi:winged helix-turn-helix transcriptional regulator [Corallococcus sp. Z5C101001]|nr:winged helix-turn-helix transcriptional regulator [Corallococcus sp. Z5C101001]